MEDRVTELEIKVAYQERLLDTLNQLVFEQQRHIDALDKRVRWLEGHAAGQPGNEPPPHY